MSRVTAAVDLPYPADLVFRVATRVPALPRWLPEVVAAELLDPALALGSRVRLTLGPGTGNAEITGVVQELRAPELLEIAGSGGPLTVAVRTRLESGGPSATRVTLELDLDTPPFLGFIAREAERRIGAELPMALERFRALLDEEPV